MTRHAIWSKWRTPPRRGRHSPSGAGSPGSSPGGSPAHEAMSEREPSSPAWAPGPCASGESCGTSPPAGWLVSAYLEVEVEDLDLQAMKRSMDGAPFEGASRTQPGHAAPDALLQGGALRDRRHRGRPQPPPEPAPPRLSLPAHRSPSPVHQLVCAVTGELVEATTTWRKPPRLAGSRQVLQLEPAPRRQQSW